MPGSTERGRTIPSQAAVQAVGVCNEQGPGPKGKVCSELGRNVESAAEMTAPRSQTGVTDCHDQFVPSGEMQMYTEKYVRPIFHPFDHFRIDPFIQPTNQRVIVSHVWVTLQMQFLSLRQHSRLTGLTNA